VLIFAEVSQYREHIAPVGGIDIPKVAEIPSTVVIRVPPGQEEIGESPALTGCGRPTGAGHGKQPVDGIEGNVSFFRGGCGSYGHVRETREAFGQDPLRRTRARIPILQDPPILVGDRYSGWRF
jgi:hypothetical protein